MNINIIKRMTLVKIVYNKTQPCLHNVSRFTQNIWGWIINSYYEH